MRVQPFSYLEQKDVIIPPSPSLDPDAEAFLNATGITDATIESAINNLVLDLKADSLWTKGIAVYPVVGGTSTTHAYNLIDPTTFQLSFFGTITHSSNGMKGDGSSGYYDTGVEQITHLVRDDVSIGVYSRENIQSGVDLGALLPGSTNSTIQTNLRNASNNHTSRVQSDDLITVSNTNSAVLGGVTRTSSTDGATFLGNSITTFTGITSRTPSEAISLTGMALNTNSVPSIFSARQQSFVWIGLGLTNTDITNLVSINETFQTALGRFV